MAMCEHRLVQGDDVFDREQGLGPLRKCRGIYLTGNHARVENVFTH